MVISNQTQENEARKFREAIAATGIPGIVVLNPDGTNVVINLAPAGTVLSNYSNHISTNTTTTPTTATAYISSIVISPITAGTTSTITIQDKQGTPLKLINAFITTALLTIPEVLNFNTPVKMSGGIDIITAGASPATLDIWINYFQ